MVEMDIQTRNELVKHYEWMIKVYRLDRDALYYMNKVFNELVFSEELVTEIVDKLEKWAYIKNNIPKELHKDVLHIMQYRGYTFAILNDNPGQQEVLWFKGKEFSNGAYNMDRSDMYYWLNHQIDCYINAPSHREYEEDYYLVPL